MAAGRRAHFEPAPAGCSLYIMTQLPKSKPSRAVARGIQRIVDRAGDISYKVQIRRAGHAPEAKRFASLEDARRWQRARESEIDLGVYADRRAAAQHTLRELLQRYRLEVTPTKRGAAIEAPRLAALERDPIAATNAAQLQADHVHAWMCRRVAAGVSGSTINRELNILSHVLTKARRGWRIPVANPVVDVERPRHAPPRDRRISEAELDAICSATESTMLPTVLRLAVATGMRRGELLGLQWEDVDLVGRMVLLRTTKNGDSRRVPLNHPAVGFLEAWRPAPPENAPDGYELRGPVFVAGDPHAISTAMRRAVRRARKAYEVVCAARGVMPDSAHLVGVRLHDGRHEAVSRLVEAGVDQLTTAKIVGHRTLAMTQRYYTARDAHLLAAVDAVAARPGMGA